MNKVYVVLHNNGEPYEDEYEWIERIFNNKYSALAYIFREGFVAKQEVEHFTVTNQYYNNNGFHYGQVRIGDYYRADEGYDISVYPYLYHDYMYVIEHLVQ